MIFRPTPSFTAVLSLCAALLSPLSHATAPAASPTQSSRADQAQNRAFDKLSHQFIEALWRTDSESALGAGRYEFADRLPAPDAAARAAQLAFAEDWLQRFHAVDTASLSTRQRTDLGLLLNKLESDRWYLTSFRAHEWDPSIYGVAGSLDLILNTEYAPKPQRLRALLKRVAAIPAYYQAAQGNLKQLSHEHAQLAIKQAPGALGVLDDIAKAAATAALTQAEKAQFKERLAAARTAIQGFVDFVSALDAQQQRDNSGRSFRIGRELYDTKFALDIASGSNAEQTYQKALSAREQLLQRMDGLADELWAKTMGSAAKPQDRTEKIGLVIDKLSAKHVAREDFFKEIRRQIPVLQDWVVKHDLIGIDPKKPLVVRETPVYARGVAGAGIQAPGPYRPQDRTYYDVTPLDGASAEAAESTLREYNHWILQILNIHEAIPGHYTQLVYANRSPSLVKSLFGNGAMVEGWAVYGERMMLESGYGDNAPEMWLMYSKWNLRSVTNTILDYSVHVLCMSEAEAIDLLTRQAFQTRQEAIEKWHRVQVSSVQLASYFSGYSEIMELREERKKALGDKFNLKAFHEQFLSYGSAPVHVIRELMQ
ncbi:DUF885 domain-containing protein [Paucibacter sp. APW11]|uniref:DUF885 domain-containing protein n=1 Tax=Roseateles aquae TaxID=3077235 RepID=A0ABU3P8V5_9BURK|nr:DUF885 domain-containing protein [Paucibacter sp. APW11]MDT8998984.1 DUF885 domain-containing protein [Paucibacter sp. APW11]